MKADAPNDGAETSGLEDIDLQEPVTAGTEEQPADWRALTRQGRYVAARNAYLVSGETDANVRAGLAALVDTQELLRERSYGRAIERLERLDMRPDFAPWDQILEELRSLKESASALDRRDPDLARELLAQVTDPWFPGELLAQLGITEVYDGNVEAAEATLEEAVQVDPQHYRAITNLGNLALEAGNVDEAIEFYQRALKIDEDFPNAHHNLGVAYRKKGQLNKSVRSLRRAQRTQQRHEVAEARESIGKWAGPSVAKYLKWIVWGVIIVGGYFLLQWAGVI